MSIDFTQSMAANQAAANQAKFADLTFDGDVQRLEFPKSQNPIIFKIDVLPVNDGLAYGRAAVHRSTTLQIVCPQGSFGKPCPICEAIRQRPREDTEFWAANHAKERAFLNVVPLNDDGMPIRLHQDHQSPVYCYSVGSSQKAKSGFWKLLTAALSSPMQEDQYKRLFTDWQSGSTLKLLLTPAEMRGNSYMEVSGIEFVPRKMQYDKAQWLPLCYQFHDMLKCVEYNEVKELFPHIFDGSITANAGGYSPHIGGQASPAGAVDNRPEGVYPPQTAGQPPAQGQPQQGGIYAPQQGQPQAQYQQQPAPQQGGFYPPQQGQPQQGLPPAPPAQSAYPQTTGSPTIF